jgi:hypothetical protein
MAATYAFDVTAADVFAEELNFVQDYTAALMDDAIERAASKLNSALRMFRIVPSSITSSSAVDDYNWCRSTIIVGAAGYYIGLSTGAWPAACRLSGAGLPLHARGSPGLPCLTGRSAPACH